VLNVSVPFSFTVPNVLKKGGLNVILDVVIPGILYPGSEKPCTLN
jgi:hypothetical protein